MISSTTTSFVSFLSFSACRYFIELLCSLPKPSRLSNTLRLVSHVHWIVIEDGRRTVRYVENILRQRGWYQRTCALQFLRNDTESVIGNYKGAVVYFGDDDNSYDTRLFTDYIRNVKKLGMWAVGLAGGGPLESPVVVNGTVVGYRAQWRPERKFAVDMAGFAVNLNDVLRTTVVFGKSCKSGFDAPEPCFLDDMGFNQTDIETFGVGEYNDKVSLMVNSLKKKQGNQNC
uniref:Galactosylgalactosylxylosylprotein 3-beta-glucuronosyltransferase n=1 Tax=Angiostrongylus cantonensis TaxID=6313 RepID=A0A0K0DMT6_ANGCA